MTHEEQCTEWIASLSKIHDEHYYENLLKFSDIILADLANYKQKYIAEKLRLPSPTLSTFKPLMEAYVRMNSKD